MPKLPEIEFVLHVGQSDTRPIVLALGNLVREMAAKANSNGLAQEKIRGPRPSLRRWKDLG